MVAQVPLPGQIRPIESNVQWMSPAPLWAGHPMRQPFIARFETDQFMDEFAALLNAPDRARRLQSCEARPLSYRRLLPGETDVPPVQVKLYQPVHGHFYLITATLVCQQLGLPDRVVNPGAQERVVFLLRRLTRINNNEVEQAWVEADGSRQWVTRSADTCRQMAPGEVCYPLFPTSYRDQDGRIRRLLAGVIPTSSRETANPPAPGSSDPLFADGERINGTLVDPRMSEFETRLKLPSQALQAAAVEPAGLSLGARQQRDASLFWLLDLAELLSLHHPGVWAGVNSQNGNTLQGEPLNLFNWLNTSHVLGISFIDLLRRAWAQRDQLYRRENLDLTINLAGRSIDIATLEARWKNALPPASPEPAAPLGREHTLTRAAPKIDAASQYIIRCVYQRPLCGCLQPDIVSERSATFQIAPFFDPDAPARPIRITMPADTSIAGLRKYTRSVGIEMSKELRRQISRVSDAKKAMNGELGDELQLDLGVICSFSIPIITIVALLLLMIFIILLNIVFWWIPFFRLCFPIKR